MKKTKKILINILSGIYEKYDIKDIFENFEISLFSKARNWTYLDPEYFFLYRSPKISFLTNEGYITIHLDRPDSFFLEIIKVGGIETKTIKNKKSSLYKDLQKLKEIFSKIAEKHIQKHNNNLAIFLDSYINPKKKQLDITKVFSNKSNEKRETFTIDLEKLEEYKNIFPTNLYKEIEKIEKEYSDFLKKNKSVRKKIYQVLKLRNWNMDDKLKFLLLMAIGPKNDKKIFEKAIEEVKSFLSNENDKNLTKKRVNEYFWEAIRGRDNPFSIEKIEKRDKIIFDTSNFINSIGKIKIELPNETIAKETQERSYACNSFNI